MPKKKAAPKPTKSIGTLKGNPFIKEQAQAESTPGLPPMPVGKKKK
jgi:hypothetical protein